MTLATIAGVDLRSAAELAIALARDAGDLAVAEREVARIEPKGAGGDLVTHVDREAEHRIATALVERFPEHAVLGEESGERGAGAGARFGWLIDPLDGTNNYVLGSDIYGVCITLCEGPRPVVAVVHDSPGRRTFWAIAGQGAWLSTDGTTDATPLSVGPTEPLDRTTVSFTQGYCVGHDDPRRNVLFDALERGTKRVLRTWAPSFDWGLLVTGRLGAVVAYRNEIWDLAGGALLAEEAGATVITSPDEHLVIVGRPQTAARLSELLDSSARTSPPPTEETSSDAQRSPFSAIPREDRIAENELAYAVWDAYPVSPGHALIIPVREITTWFDATPEEQRAARELLGAVQADLDATHRPDGYNVGFNAGTSAGQTVFHAHLHVIPRYAGDVDDPTGGVRNGVIGRELP